MALFKCKMCGGSLEVAAGETIIECEYCGTQQTLPKTTDENIQSLFNRANLLRQKNEFDKAEAVYEKILEADDTEAEAYWGVILCKFGIEYVEDPKTYKRIPTCHRTSYDSIVADEYYKKAIEYADITQRSIYEAEAKKIDEIQKGILAISAQEEPYDVFICYKESDESGKRTQDSVIANDIYYQLTEEGFKVFYAAITLEDKLGSAYEPYIFAALNSAKIMVVLGTKPEYFSAVWVKNEWSRFLKIIQNDRSKLLIPCYRDMDAYELPEEFAHLQSQDMGKIGFINDIVRGIKKVVVKNEPKNTVIKETVVASEKPSVEPLLKRAFMFLEDGEFSKANDFCEQVLNQDPENAQAYLCKLLSELRVRKTESLKDLAKPFDQSSNYKKVIRFADESVKATLLGYAKDVNDRYGITLEAAKKRTKLYKKITLVATSIACAIIAFIIVLNTVIIPNIKYNQAIALMDASYTDAIALMDEGKLNEAYSIFIELGNYKDAANKAIDILLLLKKFQLKNVKEGDYINFGTYEQDNNASNGEEDIEWLVLEVKDGKALIISKYALDCNRYDANSTSVTWETCTLRKWLNNDFINTAFSDEEKAMIPAVTVSADKNLDYSTTPGNETQDQVFLLSGTEAFNYFNSDIERQCYATDYAVARGVYVASSGNCWWWLRSPGGAQNRALRVSYSGSARNYGVLVSDYETAIRPALWIDLNF